MASTTTCTFTCNWFHSYRNDCIISPCLSTGQACETAGASPGASCSDWCCVYEPVRGLIFLLPALVGVFLICVVVRCAYRYRVLRRRRAEAAKVQIVDEAVVAAVVADDVHSVDGSIEDRSMLAAAIATKEPFSPPPSARKPSPLERERPWYGSAASQRVHSVSPNQRESSTSVLQPPTSPPPPTLQMFPPPASARFSKSPLPKAPFADGEDDGGDDWDPPSTNVARKTWHD